MIVFRRVLHILECHTIRLPIRQRIIDMFGKNVMRQIVLEDNDDDEDEEEDEEDEDENDEDDDEDDERNG